MTSQPAARGAFQPLPRVRRTVWGVLALAVLLALALPVATVWHAASRPLQVHAYLWPSTPHAGQTPQVIIVLTDDADRTATDGPWAEVAAIWDMATMTMGTRSATLPGNAHQAGAFALPLHVDMAGHWWVRVSVSTPGRPMWQTSLQFTVLPALSATSAATLAHPPLERSATS
ncbi:MAG: hypothetical protein OJF49_003177 [Ktedonobacterales bacterium]|nr:MAG: hypothetical protein OJF49_003177 [Ktedonobacterales bacterium]